MALSGGLIVTTKGNFLKLRPADCWKMNFSRIVLGILEFLGSFEEKVTRKIQRIFLDACF